MRLWKTTKTWAVLAVCAAAVVVPAQALAMPGETNGPTMRQLHELKLDAQNPSIGFADRNDRAHFGRLDALSSVPQTAVRPDDRAGVRGIDPGATVIVSEPSGFDWSDAGIGALGMFAAVAILAGAMLLAGYSQRRHKVAVL